MKILAFSEFLESQRFFQQVFANKPSFLDIDFANFIPDKHYYDVIVAETYSESLDSIKNTTIVLFKNNNNIIKNNLLTLETSDSNLIFNTLKNIHLNQKFQQELPNDFKIKKEEFNNNQDFNSSKQLVLKFENDHYIIKKVQESLKNYDIPDQIKYKIHMVFSEVSIHSKSQQINGIVNFFENKVVLYMPINEYWFLQGICDDLIISNNAIQITWFK